MLKKLACALAFSLVPVLAKSAPLFNPGGSFVTNTSTSPNFQSFNVRSSTVSIRLRVDSIVFPNGTIQVSSPTAGGGGGSSLPLPPGDTNYIQNSLTPTTTSQVFSVSTGTVTGNFSANNGKFLVFSDDFGNGRVTANVNQPLFTGSDAFLIQGSFSGGPGLTISDTDDHAFGNALITLRYSNSLAVTSFAESSFSGFTNGNGSFLFFQSPDLGMQFGNFGGLGLGCYLLANSPSIDHKLAFGGSGLALQRGSIIWSPTNSKFNIDRYWQFDSSMTLSGGVLVQNILPTSGQVLKFDGTNWAPGTDTGLTPNSTFYIQNTSTPTISTQVFNVSSGTVAGQFSVAGASNSLVLKGSASGAATTIAPVGSDTFIGLLIDSKGVSQASPNMLKLQSLTGGPVWVGSGAQASGTNGNGLYISNSSANTYIASFKNTVGAASNFGPVIVAGDPAGTTPSLRVYEMNQAAILFQIMGNGATYLTSNVTTAVPLNITAKAAQIADLTQWNNSAGVVLSSVNASGGFTTGTTIYLNGPISLSGNAGAAGQIMKSNGAGVAATWGHETDMGALGIANIGSSSSAFTSSGGLIVNSSLTITNPNNLFVKGGMQFSPTLVTSNYTITSTDTIVLSSGGPNTALTLTLPSGASFNGQTLEIYKVDKTTQPVTINAAAGETIFVTTNTFQLWAPGAFAKLKAYPSGWIGDSTKRKPYIGVIADRNAGSVLVANRAHMQTYYSEGPTVFKGMSYTIVATSNTGTTQIGFYDEFGVAICTSAATANQSAAVNIEQDCVTPGYFAGGTFRAAIVVNNTTVTIGSSGGSAGFGINTFTSAAPLPATFTYPGSTTSTSFNLKAVLYEGDTQ